MQFMKFFVCVRFWCAGNVYRIIGLCSLEETNSDHSIIIQGVVRGTENPLSLQEMGDSFQRKINFRTKSFILCQIFSEGATPAVKTEAGTSQTLFVKQSKLNCRGKTDSKFHEVAGFVYSSATMNLTTAMMCGIEFIIFGHPMEHRTRCKRDLACHFVALFCRFTFVYAMMSGISIDVMLSFTLYIKS